ncbi:hypothetical protein NX02_00930 [Sphingomonas sanxanigenens DSM 19645 = NX02]|uniref:Uncharacterized protein n=1 Tax=Sphingomonas sanxanigenens DSM 19645 = NX02 TaxID=1123269 RepID=W0A649_9SPHN|nr:hypothetical protein NX02_00930 [Sphingomonas sanxanigenens DSM 19645 = NX02]
MNTSAASILSMLSRYRCNVSSVIVTPFIRRLCGAAGPLCKGYVLAFDAQPRQCGRA